MGRHQAVDSDAGLDFKIVASQEQTAHSTRPFHTWTLSNGSVWLQFFRESNGYLLRFPNIADFQVLNDGLHVQCIPCFDVQEATIHHLYLNQVSPLVMGKHGKLVFHGGAVEVGEHAVVFLAESGRGKSTLAASFALNGHRFLTDDGLVLDEKFYKYLVQPSHPSIRLWADSRKALVPPHLEAEPALKFTSKSRFLAGQVIAFCNEPKPLGRVYFIGDGLVNSTTFEKLGPGEALIEWVRHSFLLDIEDKKLLASHFDRVAKLAHFSSCYRLNYPRLYQELPAVRKAIILHSEAQGSESIKHEPL